MSKFPDPFLHDYRSKYKEKNKRGVSKHSSFQPFFNSDEFYNPVYTESVTSVEQQLDILANGNAQNATHALNSLSFLLENPFKKLSKDEKVSIGICGNLLYYSMFSFQQMLNSIGWQVEPFDKKKKENYTYILLGIRPNEQDLSLCTSRSIPLTVEYHCKRYFERYSIPIIQTDFTIVTDFVGTVLQQQSENKNTSVDEITTALFAIELFGNSKVIRVQAREYLKEYLNDEQKDALRLHWFKQPSKYTYNPKFFHDVSMFLETVGMNGQLFQETAYQLTTLPTTQELLASNQASVVIASLMEMQFRSEFFESIPGILLKQIDALTLQLESLNSLQEARYLSFQYCEISMLKQSDLPSFTYLSLVQCKISENDFCTLIESLPSLKSIYLSEVTILPSKNSQMFRLKFPQCESFTITQLDYEYSNDFYKKIATIPSLKKLSLENYSITSSLQLVQFTRNTVLEELQISGFSLSNISQLRIVSKKLRFLSLRSTGITSLEGIESFSSLTSLQISDEMLNDLRSMRLCKKLQTVSLRSCSLVTFPLEILDSTRLEEVDLSSNSLQEVQLKGKKSSRLQRLICSNNQIQQCEISSFPHLEYIYLSKNDLNVLPHFIQLHSNKEVTIDLFDNPLEPKEVEKAMKLIRKGWRILCSLPKNDEESSE